MSREKNPEDYEAANKALISREERKLEKARDKAEALERNAGKALAKMLKAGKNKLRKEAANAVQRSESGNLTANERAIIEAAQRGDGQVFIDEGTITGYDEAGRALFDDDEEDY
jgi:hypothetical protein